jgi:Domain of unknown function (DUF4277)
MRLVPPPIAASQVHHLPIVKAYAAKMGVVEVLQQVVPSEMAVAPGTLGLGLLLAPLRGRSPLSRLEECCAHPDTAWLLGKAVAPAALPAATVGRVLDRLDERGTMKLCTAWAVRADQVLGLDKRSGHVDTTAVSV